jgi:hypothetical protein
MSKIKTLTGLILILGLMAAPAAAGEFDGQQNLICASMDVIECLPGGECNRRTALEVNFPDFIRINFKDKAIRTEQDGGEKLKTTIERMETVDGKIIIQGAEDGHEDTKDGLGWTIAIDEENGKMVLSASGTEVAFVVFGSCTLP